jgi:hypothetical protein
MGVTIDATLRIFNIPELGIVTIAKGGSHPVSVFSPLSASSAGFA